MLQFLKWTLFASGGAAFAAALWILFAQLTGKEFAWLTILIGGLAGLAVRKAAGDERTGLLPGLAAVGPAALAYLVARWFIVVPLLEEAWRRNGIDPELQGLDIAAERVRAFTDSFNGFAILCGVLVLGAAYAVGDGRWKEE